MSKEELNKWAILLNTQLRKIFSYHNGVSIDKLMNCVIEYPIFK